MSKIIFGIELLKEYERIPDIPGWTDGETLEFLENEARGRKTIVEIGSFDGRGAVTMAKVCDGLVYCIDPWLWDGYERPLPDGESLHYFYRRFLRNVMAFGVNDKIVPMLSTSNNAWQYFSGQKNIDLLFIDGEHSYLGCLSDLSMWYDLVVNGGVVCGDDYKSPSVKKAMDYFVALRGLVLELRDDNKLWILRK